MKSFTVALLYNLKQNAPHGENPNEPWDAWNELDSERTAAGIERALRAGGHEVIAMEGDVHLAQKLEHYHVDIAFNTCEGHRSSSREAQVPAILDMLGIPYTGSGVMTLALALDKPMSKRILSFYGLPTPAFQNFVTGLEPLDARLQFPLFVKPSREGSGIGITAKSVCQTAQEMRDQVQHMIHDYHQPAIVEEFIDGRELTIGLLGNLSWNIREMRAEAPVAMQQEWALAGGVASAPVKPVGNGRARTRKLDPKTHPTLRVFPSLEVDLTPCPPDQRGLYTSVIKSQMYNVPKYLCPAPVSKALEHKLERLAVNAFAALECLDFARVDVRLRGETLEPTILEVNPLAGLQEGISDIVMEAEAGGVGYAELINGILNSALQRYGLV